MKRSELIPGKAYYYSNRTDWEKGYTKYNNLCQAGIRRSDNKVTVVRTYLETNYEKQRLQREVLVLTSRGVEKWIPLAHIRGTFKECIKTVYAYNKVRDERDVKYSRHLSRKHSKEVHTPALKEMQALIKEMTGHHLSDWTTVENLKTEQIQTIVSGLKSLQSQKVEA